MKEKYKHIIVTVVILSILIALSIFTLNETLENINERSGKEVCDYDSCSQEADSWNYTGKKCFNESNPKCRDFLRLWNVCQNYRARMGIC